MSAHTTATTSANTHTYTQDSIAYIQHYYAVPAAIGRRICFLYDRINGTIIGAQDSHLMVRFDNNTVGRLHPLWNVIYLDDNDRPL